MLVSCCYAILLLFLTVDLTPFHQTSRAKSVVSTEISIIYYRTSRLNLVGFHLVALELCTLRDSLNIQGKSIALGLV